jgi:hypothetical protein
VATWWSSLGKACKAVAVLNVGAVAAPDVHVELRDIGLPAAAMAHTVTDVYEQKSWAAVGGGFNVSVPGMGGTLLVVAAAGTKPMSCMAEQNVDV